MVRVHYNTYPTSKAATKYSRKYTALGAYGGFFSIWLTIFAVLNYINSVVKLYNELNVINYLKALSFLIVMAIAILYFGILHNKIVEKKCKLIMLKEMKTKDTKSLQEQIKKENKKWIIGVLKKFLRRFVVGLFAGTGLIGCVKSVYELLHGKMEITELVISILLFLFGTVIFMRKNIIKMTSGKL